MANGLLSPNPLDDPDYDYGTILPFRQRNMLDIDETSDDGLEIAFPSLLRDVGNAAVRMGQTLKGERRLDAGNLFMDAMDFAPGALLAGRMAPKGAVLGANVFQGGPHKYGPDGAAAKREKIAALRAEANANRDSYAGIHRPPMRDSGAPAHDLTGGGSVYPDDIYSPNAVQYYGTGNRVMDGETVKILNKLKGTPDKMVSIYRAVPSGAKGAKISAGDWVTVNRNYAKDHGEGVLRGDYVIIERRVPARDIYTNGDSLHEFGFDPAKADSQDVLDRTKVLQRNDESFLPVRNASENLSTVVDANTIQGRVVGDETVNISTLTGGVSGSKRAQDAVNSIAEQMRGPNGYIERLIVDQDGNVIEGAHRLEALRKLGITNVPITRIVDPSAGLNMPVVKQAIKDAGPIHSDHVNQIAVQIGEMLTDVGGDAARVRAEYVFPRGFEKFYEAALKAASRKKASTETVSPKLQSMPGVPVMGLLNNDDRPGGTNLLGLYTGGVI